MFWRDTQAEGYKGILDRLGKLEQPLSTWALQPWLTAKNTEVHQKKQTVRSSPNTWTFNLLLEMLGYYLFLAEIVALSLTSQILNSSFPLDSSFPQTSLIQFNKYLLEYAGQC